MAQHTFRSAFNGFNREDVVHYIEYLNAQHATEINRLQSELEFLRSGAAQQAAVEEEIDSSLIAEQAARIRELFDYCKELEEKLAAAEEAKAHADEKLQAVVTQQNSFQARANEELEAYRRAERIERQAKERAEQLYQQSNGALAEASIRVEEAASQIGQLSDMVMAQIAQLQNAVCGTKQAMKEASQILYTIHPQE